MPLSVLVLGQSNAMGRYGPVAAPPPRDDVLAWDWKQKAFVRAQLGVLPFWPVAKIGGPAGNLGYTLACAIADYINEQVTITLLASDAKRIEYFLPDQTLAERGWTNTQPCRHFGASMAPFLYGPTSDSQLSLQAAGKSCYDLIAVHQGEAHVTSRVEPPDLILEKYAVLIDALRESGLAAPATDLIFGRISPKYKFESNHAAALNALKARGIAIAEWRDIEDLEALGVRGDYHASGEGLAQLGMRFFEQWLVLRGNPSQR